MPSVAVKLYSTLFKTRLKHKLQHHTPPTNTDDSPRGHVSRSSDGVPANAIFVDGVATKDINIDAQTRLSFRIFLPESALPQELAQGNTGLFGHMKKEASDLEERQQEARRQSDSGCVSKISPSANSRRSSWGGEILRSSIRNQGYASLDIARSSIMEENQLDEAGLDEGYSTRTSSFNNCMSSPVTEASRHSTYLHDSTNYQGYLPDFTADNHKKLPIIMQFHGGGFVSGSKDSAGNDLFCRRIAKLCDAIVISVGYRLALEHKYPAAFDDGFEALNWLAKQMNLAECSKLVGHSRSGSMASRSGKRANHKELIDNFSGSMVVESWIAAHGDSSRCVLLGMSSGANIADFVARKSVQAGRLLEPVKIVAQVLMYPFFIGSVPTQSEIKLANSYFFDRPTCILAWKLLFSEKDFNLDHPVANPLVQGRKPPLKHMPPTLTVVGELDWMKDRAIAYSEALRNVNIDAPVLEYKDAVHEFATLHFLVKSRQAEACAEDITIWVKKYISQKGHEFSY